MTFTPGQRLGKLTITAIEGNSAKCKCDCGANVVRSLGHFSAMPKKSVPQCKQCVKSNRRNASYKTRGKRTMTTPKTPAEEREADTLPSPASETTTPDIVLPEPEFGSPALGTKPMKVCRACNGFGCAECGGTGLVEVSEG